ncbi:MAG: FAD-binding dehydrogenase [Chitinophagaceae bacterium]|nr:MAG: FAD-binding dehydrogenase [Chitinophagaceae bacterium]
MHRIENKADVLIIGGGIAGIVSAIELLKKNKTVIILDRDEVENFGGLAKESFGGVFMVDSPIQKRNRIKDSVELAKSDWFSSAEFNNNAKYEKEWANYFIENNREKVYNYLSRHSVSFFPVVHWVERGLFHPGNSLPRFHMVWGTGLGLINSLLNSLKGITENSKFKSLFRHKVHSLHIQDGKVKGVFALNEADNTEHSFYADSVIIASGGMCGGDLSLLKKNWYEEWGSLPETILNGSHKYADGSSIKLANQAGGVSANLHLQWNYAAGVHHPRPKRDNHGLSLVPPKSALWVNYQGKRFENPALITAFDTRYLVERICKEPVKMSWQIMNYKIALKELAVSGSEYNDAIRDKKIFAFLKNVLFGNKNLINDLMENCKDVVFADNVEELVHKMNALQQNEMIDADDLKTQIEKFDNMLSPSKFRNDDQLRRIAQLRSYRGDRLRTCNFQKILDKKAGPLIAIREFILSRKSLGGCVTNLKSQVLDKEHEPIPGLYAVGEAAGYGGGGIHGKRALEGTFLAACIVNAQNAADAISRGY